MCREHAVRGYWFGLYVRAALCPSCSDNCSDIPDSDEDWLSEGCSRPPSEHASDVPCEEMQQQETQGGEGKEAVEAAGHAEGKGGAGSNGEASERCPPPRAGKERGWPSPSTENL